MLCAICLLRPFVNQYLEGSLMKRKDSEYGLTLAKPKSFLKLKTLAITTKIFAVLYGLAKRVFIGFRINKMLETLILQGCMVCEPVEHTMTNQKVGRVGTIFANMRLIKDLKLCRCFAWVFLRISRRLNGNQGINYAQVS